MAKVFRAWDVDQGWLLPPSLHEFVPPGHMAHFVRDTVRDVLDLSAILETYTEERGYPPYHPGMMVALLLYGYSRGLYSSRQLARACEDLRVHRRRTTVDRDVVRQRIAVLEMDRERRTRQRTRSEPRKRHGIAVAAAKYGRIGFSVRACMSRNAQ